MVVSVSGCLFKDNLKFRLMKSRIELSLMGILDMIVCDDNTNSKGRNHPSIYTNPHPYDHTNDVVSDMPSRLSDHLALLQSFQKF